MIEDPLQGGQPDPLDSDEVRDRADGPRSDDRGGPGGSDPVNLQEAVFGGFVEEDEDVRLPLGSDLGDNLLGASLHGGLGLNGRLCFMRLAPGTGAAAHGRVSRMKDGSQCEGGDDVEDACCFHLLFVATVFVCLCFLCLIHRPPI